MQVFKAFIKISRQSIGIILTYTIIFIVFLEMMSRFNSTATASEFTESSINIAVIDNDNSSLSNNLLKYIDSKHNIIDIDTDIDDIRDAMYRRSVDYVLIIPENFYENIIAGNNISLESYKLPDSIAAEFVELQLNNFISVYTAYIDMLDNSDLAYEKTANVLKAEAEVSVAGSTSNDEISIPHYFYMFLTYILLSVIVMCITPILITMNTEEIKIRTLCSSLSSVKRNIFIAISTFSLGLIIFLLFTVFSLIRFSSDMFSMVGMLRILNCFIYMIVCLGISFSAGVFLKNRNTVSMLANVIGLGSSFLTGVFVDRSLLAPSVLAVGKFLPCYWYINVENELLRFGNHNTRTIIYGYGMQILFAIVLFALGIVFSKSKKSE